ncbi:MAG: DUF4190 domain-containing protein [Verrucomicrobiota bacterium]
MQWHYVTATKDRKEISEEDLARLVAEEEVKRDTLIWREGMTDWLPVSQVRPEFFGGTPVDQAAFTGPVAEVPGEASSVDALSGDAPGSVPNAQMQGAPSYPYPAAQRPTCGLSIASMVCGIVGILLLSCYGFGVFPAIGAVITGHMSKANIAKANGALAGEGFALTGLITGYLSIGLVALGVILILIFGVAAVGLGTMNP